MGDTRVTYGELPEHLCKCGKVALVDASGKAVLCEQCWDVAFGRAGSPASIERDHDSEPHEGYNTPCEKCGARLGHAVGLGQPCMLCRMKAEWGESNAAAPLPADTRTFEELLGVLIGTTRRLVAATSTDPAKPQLAANFDAALSAVLAEYRKVEQERDEAELNAASEMLEAYHKVESANAELEQRLADATEVLKKLTFEARISGGTAGRNERGGMKFRKKPVVIEAVQFTRVLAPADLHVFLGDFRRVTLGDDHILIETLEGTMRADENDWIIKGVKGEFYPCKPDIFEATYEAVQPAEPAPPTKGAQP